MDATEVFVGRDELIEELGSSLSPDTVVIGDTFGIYGIGKSKLLDRLREDVPKREAGPCVVLHTDLADFGVKRSDAALGLRALERSYKTYQQLLGAANDDLKRTGRPLEKRLGGIFALSLRTALKEHTKISIVINQHLSLGAGEGDQEAQNVNIEVTEAAVRNMLDTSQAVLEGEFAEMINELSATSRVLWTIDGFELIADQELGRWLLSLFRSLRNTLVVLARTPLEHDPELPGEVQRHPLRRLNRDEVRAFLEACDEGVDEELVTAVYEYTAGHPLSVAMVAQLHQTLPAEQRAGAAFARVLAALPSDAGEANAKLARDILAGAGIEGLDRVVEACAVAKVFDVEMLAALVADDITVPPRKLVETLRRQTFVEELPDRVTTSYRVHAFIGSALERGLLRDDPARFRELHRRAAAHHYSWLNDYEETSGTKSYAAWYRYDDPVWQSRERAWLYHEASIAQALPEGPERDAQRQAARVRFARVFVDAFWWWACYLEFPFSHELIDDWERTQDDREDWLRELRALLANYPTGYRKERPAEVWSAVEDSLLAILDACGLAGDPAELEDEDEGGRHTLALIENFLAHSERYRPATNDAQRNRRYQRALEHYDRAHELLVQDQDWWDDAWTLFERAELHFDFGHPDEAARDWDAAAELLLDEEKEVDDEELTANMHRLRADMLWAADERAAALRGYGRAVAHAYLFQNRPHEPDAYTAAFYDEMLDRAVTRLREACVDGLALEECTAALRAWLGDVDAVDSEALRTAVGAADDTAAKELVLPAPPREPDLLAKDSPFIRRWRRIYRDVRDDLAGDLASAA